MYIKELSHSAVTYMVAFLACVWIRGEDGRGKTELGEAGVLSGGGGGDPVTSGGGGGGREPGGTVWVCPPFLTLSPSLWQTVLPHRMEMDGLQDDCPARQPW